MSEPMRILFIDGTDYHLAPAVGLKYEENRTLINELQAENKKLKQRIASIRVAGNIAVQNYYSNLQKTRKKTQNEMDNKNIHKKQAKISDLAALKCSLLHWQQLCNATKKELLKAYRNRRKVTASIDFCACCIRAKSDCTFCPLGGKETNYRDCCCNGLWSKAFDNLCDLDYSIGTFQDFRLAARKVRDYIKQKIKEK